MWSFCRQLTGMERDKFQPSLGACPLESLGIETVESPCLHTLVSKRLRGLERTSEIFLAKTTDGIHLKR